MRNIHSPLADYIENGVHGVKNAQGAGIIIREIEDYHLVQIGFSDESFENLTARIGHVFGFEQTPNHHHAQITKDCYWQMPEVFKYWLDVLEIPKIVQVLKGIATDNITSLDITDGKIVVDLYGANIMDLWARLFAVDLSLNAMKIGDFRALSLHHVPVHLLRQEDNFQFPQYRLYIPRSFAAFVVKAMVEQSYQFGVEVI